MPRVSRVVRDDVQLPCFFPSFLPSGSLRSTCKYFPNYESGRTSIASLIHPNFQMEPQGFYINFKYCPYQIKYYIPLLKHPNKPQLMNIYKKITIEVSITTGISIK